MRSDLSDWTGIDVLAKEIYNITILIENNEI